MDFDSAISQQKWNWLLDLPQRLNVAIEILGSTGCALLPAAPTPTGRVMRGLVTGDDSFRSAIDSARQSGTRQFAAAGSLQVVCIPLESRGMLVIGREAAADIEPARCRRDLDHIGTWLAPVVQDAATKRPDELSLEPYRISSLERILGEAAARGSARSVLGAFAEALAVWDDIHVVAYSVTLSGRCIPFVWPVGRSAPDGPLTLEGGAVGGELVRLPAEEAERLQLRRHGDDVLVQQLTSGDRVHWLLVFCGNIPVADEVGIALYSAILRETLNRALVKSVGQTAELDNRRPLPQPGEPLEPIAEALAQELMRLVDAQASTLAIRMNGGRQALAVGRTELLPPSDTKSIGNRLTVTSFDADTVMVFVAARDQPEFTTVHQTTAETAAAGVHRWLRTALNQSTPFERRRRTRPTDAIFEELARDAVAQGQQVSVAVVSLGTALLRPGTMQSCVAKVRAGIRSLDFAAALNDSEIVLLLCSVDSARANGVVERLAGVLASGPEGVPFRPVIGLATVAPGDEIPASMIQAARANFPAVA